MIELFKKHQSDIIHFYVQSCSQTAGSLAGETRVRWGKQTARMLPRVPGGRNNEDLFTSWYVDIDCHFKYSRLLVLLWDDTTGFLSRDKCYPALGVSMPWLPLCLMSDACLCPSLYFCTGILYSGHLLLSVFSEGIDWWGHHVASLQLGRLHLKTFMDPPICKYLNSNDD